MKIFLRFLFGLSVFVGICCAPAAEQETLHAIGVAKIDITPDYPVRLSGYGNRRKESEGVTQRIFAKALAMGSDQEGPAILITVDNCGVPASIRDEVAGRLNRKKGIKPERVAICSSHSHSAPCLTGILPNLFSEPVPPEHQAQIDRYTRELTDKMEQVALAALADRKPGKLSWSQGKAGFAKNRRSAGGPVDHDLPILAVADAKGKLRAVVANYACHCTTVDGVFNQICGDWAGYAQEFLERDHPGAIVLAAIGCGADADPFPRTGLDLAKRHGQEIATEVNRLLANPLTTIQGKLECRTKQIELPFDTLPTRQQWEERAKQSGAVGYHAKVNLARLDRGEALPIKLPYLVQTWNFGNDLAMVFLPGEVVVDYSLRLKKEFDSTRLWVNAYANDVPCYIPSRRILKEGGYEGGSAMVYYDRPTKLAMETEDLIIGAVHDLMPKGFLFDKKKAEFPPPKSPRESLAAIQTKPGFEIELVVAEPLIVDPVAIDWGADGKLWVAEMHDYPAGLDGNWKPGSRVKYLEDINGDGKYDQATLFLDNLPFATGVMAWRKGALVCTAPDILYAEDTDRDGRADVVKKIFTGFYTDNYQARVNGLSFGLDNWVYGANGLLGGVIRGVAGGKEVDIRGRDFRMNPDTAAFEPVSGLTQQGRVRDDWGNWFGCDNGTLIWHFPLPEQYVRRNPFVAAATPRVYVAAGPEPTLLHPISRALERFNDPSHINHVTSGCGLGLYRDEILGADFAGNAFVCEPVHNLVHRLVLKSNGITFTGLRDEGEQQSEFLASRDNWFRPVQVRTGPDGALWVVDMYRFVIEHPRWISPERLAELDVRAGDDKGRIYRVYPRGKKLRRIPNLTKLSTAELVAALETPNGTERDRVHQELFCRADNAAVRPLEELAVKSQLPAVRLQALCALDGLDALSPGFVEPVLADAHPSVRANAVRLSETLHQAGRSVPAAPSSGSLASISPALLKLAADPEITVRYQLALSLGEWNAPRAGEALGQLATKDMGDSWMRAAILSSATHYPAEILKAVFKMGTNEPGRAELIGQLIATAAGQDSPELLGQVIATVAPTDAQSVETWQLSALSSLLDSLDRKNLTLATFAVKTSPEVRNAIERIKLVFSTARQLAVDDSAKDVARDSAIRLLGRGVDHQEDDLQLLIGFLKPTVSARVQHSALETLKRNRNPRVAGLLLRDWKLRSPSMRQSILDILLSRDEWIKELLAALENGTVQPGEISPANQQRLIKHSDQQIQQRAAAVLKTNNSSRAEVLANYQRATTLAGDSVRGASGFAKNCASCHALRGQGHSVGPNLAPLADKSAGDFLIAILDPNAVVEPRFASYNVEMKDGRSLAGIVSAETATTLTLVQGGGVQEKILRSDIAEIKASVLSLMPEGLEQAMTPQDVADLIAYLKTSPAAFGSASSEKAAAARQRFLDDGVSGPAKIISASERLDYPSWMGVLPLLHCRQTDGKSKVAWQSSPTPPDIKPEMVQTFRLPVAMGFLSLPAGTFQLRLNGKEMLDFNVSLHDQTWQSADGKLRMGYTVMENNAEDSNGILLIEVAGLLLEAGKPATFEVVGSQANSQRWFGVYQVAEVQTADAKKLSLAEQILSDSKPAQEREAIINEHPELAAKFLREMTNDLTPGTPEEYRRIPWIWRVTIRAGKRNDANQIQQLLDLSLPKLDEPLRDWQAVVIGGGIINGISQLDVWPNERIDEIVKKQPDLQARWQRGIELASVMADDERIAHGTRYDALRMVAMDSWERRGAQLAGYLARGVNAELQQGAISGLADMKSPHTAAALVSGLGHYSKSNRELALDALLRDESRIESLVGELAAGRITKTDLGEKRLDKLVKIENQKLRARVREALFQ